MIDRGASPFATRLGAGLLALLALSACAVGPDYVRPSVATPPAFKEAQGWTAAQPADAADKGEWWAVFKDPVLDGLERQVQVSNQTLAAAEAAYREARALVAEDRAEFFPTIGLTGGASAARGANASTATGSVQTARASNATTHDYQVGGEASWAPDLWGKIRREVEGAKAAAQASDAELANARLTAQSELAQDYIELRVTDAEKLLYQRTIESDQRALQVTQNQYQAGRTTKSAMLTASSTLHGVQASLVDLDKQRTQYEHAIAVLMGQPPAEFSLQPVADWSPEPPAVPLQLPSTLLQRRPDIAAAERNAAQANAQIGVATAAYYPDLSLSASYGVESTALHTLLRSSNALWALGADVSETVIDFGAREAAVQETRAAYDASVANYRQTVLTAFQGVEDALAAASVLAREQPLVAAQVSEATQNVDITLNEYKAGTVDYTTVATAQATALSSQQTALTLQAERMAEAVDLIEALGGGWSADELASR